MKRFLTFICVFLTIYGIYDYLKYYNGDFFIKKDEIISFSKSTNDKLYIKNDEEFTEFEIKGVNLGLGKPFEFATSYSITKDEYLRWFKQIKELGANVIRVYTLSHKTFYDAFYEFNHENDDPLYLIHGIWVDDYMLNSRKSAFDDEFYTEFEKSVKDVVDAVHGRLKKTLLYNVEKYTNDISNWVYGYILGVEWESDIVAFTNNTEVKRDDFHGEYFRTENAENFEIFLAKIANEMARYESEKYGTQRAIAFSNWPTTCPVEFSENVNSLFKKYAKIDVENIKTTEKFIGGTFASYHIYPYYPEYISYQDPSVENTYLEYLKLLNQHHNIPVVISEFGVPTSRGVASQEENEDLGRNQGGLSEQEQGVAIVSMFEDIREANLAGGIVFIWQDEWFKRTWNTIAHVDLKFGVNWSDYQTNEQYFGLLSFDVEQVFVDGDKSEWQESDLFYDKNGYKISKKQDLRFLYLLIETENIDDKIFIPIDTTVKSGSKYAQNLDIKMSENADFVIEIDGEDYSRIWVQERYDTLYALSAHEFNADIYQFVNPPSKNSTQFNEIYLMLHELEFYDDQQKIEFENFDKINENHYYVPKKYETGKLNYGNSNPESVDFSSVSDFYFGENFIEIRLPWGLLNFANPTNLMIHDDYYENFGVDYQQINSMKIGAGDGETRIFMEVVELEKMNKKQTYNERLKQSYYILQEFWSENEHND